jgi:hypothetical protein
MIPAFNIVAVQAYNRRFTNPEVIKKHWTDGKDFQVLDTGQYFSSRDAKLLKSDGFTNVLVLLPAGGSVLIDLV